MYAIYIYNDNMHVCIFFNRGGGALTLVRIQKPKYMWYSGKLQSRMKTGYRKMRRKMKKIV